MDINPINTKKIYQSIIEQLVNMIREGKLKTGERLPPERTLAEMFNVSRASVREAFSAMEIIGLIEVRQGEGSYITDLNIAPFINTIAPLFIKNDNLETDLLDFRKLLEIEAVSLAADKNDGRDILLLEKCLDEMRDAIIGNDMILGAEADIKFHKAIFAVTNNVVLIKAAEFTAYILESSIKFNRAKILHNGDNSKVLYSQHRQIYDALKKRDRKLAGELMKHHLNFVKEMNVNKY